MSTPLDAPGLWDYLHSNGYTLALVTDIDSNNTWQYNPAAQTLIDGYTVDQARSHLKRQVDLIEAQKFDAALIKSYGFVPPAQQMHLPTFGLGVD